MKVIITVLSEIWAGKAYIQPNFLVFRIGFSEISKRTVASTMTSQLSDRCNTDDLFISSKSLIKKYNQTIFIYLFLKTLFQQFMTFYIPFTDSVMKMKNISVSDIG